ncbi:MAG: hypothetical protein MMC33_000367 [Icmadophila ericetorum]|nr:hypothetical protein [Icmadophila ericetorum]
MLDQRLCLRIWRRHNTTSPLPTSSDASIDSALTLAALIAKPFVKVIALLATLVLTNIRSHTPSITWYASTGCEDYVKRETSASSCMNTTYGVCQNAIITHARYIALMETSVFTCTLILPPNCHLARTTKKVFVLWVPDAARNMCESAKKAHILDGQIVSPNLLLKLRKVPRRSSGKGLEYGKKARRKKRRSGRRETETDERAEAEGEVDMDGEEVHTIDEFNQTVQRTKVLDIKHHRQ